MKKFVCTICMLIFFALNIATVKAVANPVTLTQGFYNLDDLNLSPTINHTIQNISTTEYAAIIVFDSNYILRQQIRLKPQSEKYSLGPIQSGSRIIIVGNGNLVIT